MFEKYAPRPSRDRVCHRIYWQLAGELAIGFGDLANPMQARRQ
jgi:hypothetical protein